MIDFSDLKIEVVENDGQKGVFKIGPLPRGYGHTLANSLRRVLLSSMPGGAVTSIKIAGVDHEYSTLKGVKENVIEIQMNIKAVGFQCESDEPQKVMISAKGVGTVTGKDIDVTDAVNVMNPDVPILTITDKGTAVEIEMIVERGYGYRLGDEGVRSEAGRLPMDADFSPVERVMFNVDETRKGEKMNLDMITMTVFTNGSVDPVEALGHSSGVLKELSARIMTLAGVTSSAGVVAEVSEAVPSEESSDDVESISVEELPLSKRTKTSLIAAKVATVGDIATKTSDELLEISGFGQKALDEVRDLLKGYGITLE